MRTRVLKLILGAIIILNCDFDYLCKYIANLFCDNIYYVIFVTRNKNYIFFMYDRSIFISNNNLYNLY